MNGLVDVIRTVYWQQELFLLWLGCWLCCFIQQKCTGPYLLWAWSLNCTSCSGPVRDNHLSGILPSELGLLIGIFSLLSTLSLFIFSMPDVEWIVWCITMGVGPINQSKGLVLCGNNSFWIISAIRAWSVVILDILTPGIQSIDNVIYHRSWIFWLVWDNLDLSNNILVGSLLLMFCICFHALGQTIRLRHALPWELLWGTSLLPEPGVSHAFLDMNGLTNHSILGCLYEESCMYWQPWTNNTLKFI